MFLPTYLTCKVRAWPFFTYLPREHGQTQAGGDREDVAFSYVYAYSEIA